MKQAAKQKFPPGWTAQKVQAVIAHYDRQTDEEGAAEIEGAPQVTETWMSVPTELVGVVTRLIEQHEHGTYSARTRNHKRTKRPSKAGK
jgi:hypothetical protein